MEIKREKSECFSFVDCAFCLRRKNLKFIFENNESTSKYSTMIEKCFNIQIKRVIEDLKICEICIKKLSGALEFKDKLDCFTISKQSTEKVYEDNCSDEYANLKLAFVVKNECLIDDCNDLESFVSELKSETDLECDKGPKSNISGFKGHKNTKSSTSIDFQSDKSDSKPENPDEKPNGKNDKIHHPSKSPSEISNRFIPSIEPSALICLVCKEEFNSRILLFEHYSNHNPIYICDLCGDVHVNKTSLIKHLSQHTFKPHPCKHCENSYASKNSLRRHVQLQHKGMNSKKGEKIFQCTVCSKNFYRKSNYDNHFLVHTGEKNFECTVCNKKFSKKWNLDSHFVVHTVEKNFECTVCNKKFFRKADLGKHFVVHTGKKNFECTVCNKKFYRKKNLDQHFVTHTGEKNFECTMCSKKFYTKYNFDNHFVVHTGEKKFECTLCNKKFSWKQALDRHFVMHTGEKNFECTVCSKKFYRKVGLDQHFAKHTGEKNFGCDVCGRSYLSKRALVAHMKIHTITRLLKCKYCKKTFCREDSWKRHLKIHT